MAMPLEQGQTTLLGALQFERPLPVRPGLRLSQVKSRSKAKLPTTCIPRSDERIRYIGGENERLVRSMFREI
jgi:hypothetical protein